MVGGRSVFGATPPRPSAFFRQSRTDKRLFFLITDSRRRAFLSLSHRRFADETTMSLLRRRPRGSPYGNECHSKSARQTFSSPLASRTRDTGTRADSAEGGTRPPSLPRLFFIVATRHHESAITPTHRVTPPLRTKAAHSAWRTPTPD